MGKRGIFMPRAPLNEAPQEIKESYKGKICFYSDESKTIWILRLVFCDD